MKPVEERAAVRRLYDRLGLGARRADIDHGVAQGFDATLQELLDPDPADPGAAATPVPKIDPLDPAGVDDPRRLDVKAERADQQQAMKIWWLDRMAAVTAPVPERLAWFWHGHFATSEDKVNRPNLMLAQNQTLRRLGLGDFRSLTRAMVADPAMILWLDGQTNRIQQPNENLGRELLELFTLGVGHYSETDVRESARALTGWNVDFTRGTASLRPAKHDATIKTVLGRPATYDADGLVDAVIATPASARFVATKLWTRLVSPLPPDPDELERLTVAYGQRTDITALLRALATSTTFQDPASSLVKSPVEWATGLARAIGARPAELDATNRKGLVGNLQALGQVPFRPPNVGGWPAGQAWLTPTATVHRLAVARTLLRQAPPKGAPAGGNARVEWARATLAVDHWSDRTRRALRGVADGSATDLLAAAAVSPEYVVSG
ncbi:DUF1800 family protein [Actinomycetospora sp. TBRC 11914]|uniref:DUF1800 domain-containing protein n=1 Tax=Actinomycetospora sp. TBRC 11914 TaxID=2729387 RepID=UPI00145D3D86|nr:DUF1800 domain-containing protein [Actinomycetospora sp. TBRC 11914]NMO90330.1 DUF1800 domain-containing protein [Actinomycetospora sp. TBRC 11914]